MNNFQKVLFRRYKESVKVEPSSMINLPESYVELINGLSHIQLSEQIWFPYIREGKEHEYCISELYGVHDIPNEINNWVNAFDMPYEELFFYGLIPFATEDGHTGLGFKLTDSKPKEVYFIDYEWQDYYFVANTYEEFIDKSYIRNYAYTYDIQDVTEQLIVILNDFLLNKLGVDAAFTLEKVLENMKHDTSDLYREYGKTAINIKQNRYSDSSGYRERFKKDADIILTVMPRGRVTDDIEADELEIYEALHNSLTAMQGIKSIRKYGKLCISELLKD